MKSVSFRLSELFVKRLSIFSFVPIIFRRFFFSFSSSSTRAVNVAVAAFLIPDELLADVFVLLADEEAAGSFSAETDDSPFACFFRFFEPGAFFSECVRPCSASFWPRSISRCLSASLVGRMTMTLSSV